MHLIVQRQRVIALSPCIADPLVPVDHQRVDAKAPKARGDAQACLATADHDHGWVVLRISLGGTTMIEPVRAPELPRIGLTRGGAGADEFLMALDLIERGQEHPGAQCAIAVRRQAEHAAGASGGGLEAEQRLDRLFAGPIHQARRGAMGRDVEVVGLRGADRVVQAGGNLGAAIHRKQVPGK